MTICPTLWNVTHPLDLRPGMIYVMFIESSCIWVHTWLWCLFHIECTRRFVTLQARWIKRVPFWDCSRKLVSRCVWIWYSFNRHVMICDLLGRIGFVHHNFSFAIHIRASIQIICNVWLSLMMKIVRIIVIAYPFHVLHSAP